MSESVEEIRLTKYSHGAGCGCKIAPAVLDKILKTSAPAPPDARLLVGNASRDDAAVYDIGNGTAVISTTDFFMPIVDDAFDFGRIAATNAMSDVYAMGGRPIMAIAILGWPIQQLPPEVAQQVLEGGRSACAEAGIPLAGGHSIDSPEPIFGLAVTGIVDIPHLKRNDTATAGCELFLTKPLGVGILATAQKKGILQAEHARIGRDLMVELNRVGEAFGKLSGVKAMTDVTGFGLLGHLSEMCRGSGLSATLNYAAVPKIPVIDHYLAQKSTPGGTQRNWDSYGHRIGPVSDAQRSILCDPQTSGGLLVAVAPEGKAEFMECAAANGFPLSPIGKLGMKREKDIYVEMP